MTARRLLARAVLALMAVHVSVAGSAAVVRSLRQLSQAARSLDEDPPAARRRVFGAPYVEAVEEIRRTIPADGAYLLVDAQEREEGALYWLRFDLAPRRALFLGRLDELAAAPQLPPRRGEASLVVIAYGREQPPRLLRRGELLRWMRGGSRDD